MSVCLDFLNGFYCVSLTTETSVHISTRYYFDDDQLVDDMYLAPPPIQLATSSNRELSSMWIAVEDEDFEHGLGNWQFQCGHEHKHAHEHDHEHEHEHEHGHDDNQHDVHSAISNADAHRDVLATYQNAVYAHSGSFSVRLGGEGRRDRRNNATSNSTLLSSSAAPSSPSSTAMMLSLDVTNCSQLRLQLAYAVVPSAGFSHHWRHYERGHRPNTFLTLEVATDSSILVSDNDNDDRTLFWTRIKDWTTTTTQSLSTGSVIHQDTGDVILYYHNDEMDSVVFDVTQYSSDFALRLRTLQPSNKDKRVGHDTPQAVYDQHHQQQQGQETPDNHNHVVLNGVDEGNVVYIDDVQVECLLSTGWA
jgi:hypothetical protein